MSQMPRHSRGRFGLHASPVRDSINKINQGKEIELLKKLQEVRVMASSKHLQFYSCWRRSKMSPAAWSRWSSRSRTELVKKSQVLPLASGMPHRSPTRQPLSLTVPIKGTSLGVCAFSEVVLQSESRKQGKTSLDGRCALPAVGVLRSSTEVPGRRGVRHEARSLRCVLAPAAVSGSATLRFD